MAERTAPPAWAVALAALVAGACTAGAATAPPGPPGSTGSTGTAGSGATAPPATAPPVTAPPATAPPATAPPATAPARPTRISVFGDSTALYTTFGLSGSVAKGTRAEVVGGAVDLGCSILRGAQRRTFLGVGPNAASCDRWDAVWSAELAARPADLAVIQDGPWEVTEQLLPGDTVWRTLGDPVVDLALLVRMVEVTDLVAAAGARSVWLTLPPIGPDLTDPAHPKTAEQAHGDTADPARRQRYNAILGKLTGLRPDTARVVDLGSWLEGTGEDLRLRPDGIHFTVATAEEVSDRFLVDAVLGAYAPPDR